MPASPLAFLLEAYQTRAPSLFLVTGPSGAGKTRWCHKLIAAAQEQQWAVAGLLSPAVLDGGTKVGIDLLDVRSGALRRLATRVPQQDGNGTEAGIVTGRWSFEPATIAWGNELLRQITPRDMVIIDELGPLELRQQQGFQVALSLLDAWRYRLACVTIRPSLVGAARMRWPWSQLVVVGESGDD
jgi:nucleoside-triphosphatase THEP1